jgi:hypothetical protein
LKPRSSFTWLHGFTSLNTVISNHFNHINLMQGHIIWTNVNIKGHISSSKLMYQLFALIWKQSDLPGIFFWNTRYKTPKVRFILYVLCASLGLTLTS